MKKRICFTIDVEPDFAGLLKEDVYYGKNNLSKLERIVRRYNLKLTAFVTGKALEANPDIIDLLRSLDSEIEQHSYSHLTNPGSKIEDIEDGIKTHKRLVGTSPLGYRAPQGIITKEEVLFLERMGIKFDSSIFPAFFPGRYNRLNFPTIPFKVKNSNILEIPFGVIPKIRIPIGLGYMQFLGLATFKFLFKLFGQQELIVFDFHTYELGKIASYNALPTLPKIGYYRAQRVGNDPANVFEDFVKFILSEGYESKYMNDIFEEYNGRTSTWEWTRN